MLFWGDYYLRWWRLPIEERACRKTDLGGGDYYLRNSWTPSLYGVIFLEPVSQLLPNHRQFAVKNKSRVSSSTMPQTFPIP